jgi:hypothetical protein
MKIGIKRFLVLEKTIKPENKAEDLKFRKQLESKKWHHWAVDSIRWNSAKKCNVYYLSRKYEWVE